MHALSQFKHPSFRTTSEFLEEAFQETRHRESAIRVKGVKPLGLPFSKSQGDTATNGTARSTDQRQDLSVIRAGLSVQKVPGINNRFSVER